MSRPDSQERMPESTATPISAPDPAESSPDRMVTQLPAQQSPWRRGFWALIAVQFQGAFSLNVLRYLLTFMVMRTALSQEHSDALVSLITLLFFIPLVLFSMAGGYLADRFSKRQITIATKVIEIVAMVVAIFALSSAQQENLGQVVDVWRNPDLLLAHFPLALVVLFIAATQAALFGPSK